MIPITVEVKERSFDEMITFFNNRVADMDISPSDKMTLLGMITAIDFKYKKDVKKRTGFTVIDKNTCQEADLEQIALKAPWAKGLCYCDMEGFAIGQDGDMYLLDECGRWTYPPQDRFEVRWEDDSDDKNHTP